MLSAFLVVKFAKVCAASLYVTGSVGAVFAKSYDDRKRFAYFLAGPGFALSWAFGILLTWQSGVELLSLWILGTAACSLLSLNGVLYIAGAEPRRTKGSGLFVLVPLVLCLFFMVTKITLS
ncbi:MAG: hypothetical protein U0174_12455 [Polyangiaceae bacterium]